MLKRTSPLGLSPVPALALPASAGRNPTVGRCPASALAPGFPATGCIRPKGRFPVLFVPKSSSKRNHYPSSIKKPLGRDQPLRHAQSRLGRLPWRPGQNNSPLLYHNNRKTNKMQRTYGIMAVNKRLLAGLAALFLLNSLIISLVQWLAPQSQAAVYQQGSQGQAVRAIQQKLQRWGYYDGEVDGIYGSQTVKAVKYFQRRNGLSADGVVGSATLKALGMAEFETSAGSGAGRDNDLYLLARMISAEARGEPYEGQVAVGAVILNRVRHPSFPNSVSGVIYQPGAFSALDDGQYDQPVADSSRRAAQDAMSGWDPTDGAIYYYNPAKTTNQWIYSRPVVARIGDHVFAV